jgi:hypothetical protein
MRFHNCCFCILVWLFRVDFPLYTLPPFQFRLLMGDEPSSVGFGPLFVDVTPLRRSLRRILWCEDATISLGDASLDWYVRKVSYSGRHEDSLDWTSQFHLLMSGRSQRPGHSAGVCWFLVSSWAPSRSKHVKCPLERLRFSSCSGKWRNNQGYF